MLPLWLILTSNPWVKGQVTDICVAVIRVRAKFPSEVPGPPRATSSRDVQRRDASSNPRWAEPLICHSQQKQICFFPPRFYKCRICLRLPEPSFLTFPLVLSSCCAPALAWINNRRLQSGRSLRGPQTFLSSQLIKESHRWFILQTIRQCSSLFAPHFFFLPQTCDDTLMDELR